MSPGGAANALSGFCVARGDLRRWRWDERHAPGAGGLAPGQILVGIAKFAFTANNVTYARLGDQIAGWRFFPAPAGCGYIPVWGLGNVLHSRHSEVLQGERVSGYFPVAPHLVMQPGRLRGARFVDGTKHRLELPQTYNEREPDPSPAPVVRLVVLLCRVPKGRAVLRSAPGHHIERIQQDRAWPWLPAGRATLERSRNRRADIGRERRFRGAAGRVRSRPPLPRQLSSLPGKPSVFVDIAGHAAMRAQVHCHLRDSLRHSGCVGFTHWDALGTVEPNLLGPAPELFFTPDHILKRRGNGGQRRWEPACPRPGWLSSAT
jgi:hypothetical protein